MSVPTIVWSETNGGGNTGMTQSILQATTTDGISVLQFASVDQPSSQQGLSNNYQIAPGANSFEKYLRLKLTSLAPNSISGFSLFFAQNALADSAGAANLAVKFAVNQNYTPPVATTSSVATTDSSTARGAAAAVPFTGPTNALGYQAQWLVFQAQVAAGAAQGGALLPNAFIQAALSWS